MSLIWWILPSIAGVLGLILLFAGFAKMAGLKPFAGVARLAFGSGFLPIELPLGEESAFHGVADVLTEQADE